MASQSDQAQSWNVRYRRQSGVLSGADRSASKQTVLPQNRYQNQGQRGGLRISGKFKLLKEFSSTVQLVIINYFFANVLSSDGFYMKDGKH